MAFIKHGDGKIVSVMDEEELSEEQKKVAQNSLKQIKQSNSDLPSKEDKGAN